MPIIRSRTVAFSGHRTFKMSGVPAQDGAPAELFPFDDPVAGSGSDASLAARIDKVVASLCAEGFDTFLCGMAEGFDLEAAEAVLRLRDAGRSLDTRGIHLVAVLPYRGQAERFDGETRARYDAVLAAADETVVLVEEYFPGCFHARNDYLVDHASALLCYYNGSPGGTRYTFRRALKAGLRIVNLL